MEAILIFSMHKIKEEPFITPRNFARPLRKFGVRIDHALLITQMRGAVDFHDRTS